MEVDYFGKCEQIRKREGAMIIMNIKVDNFYSFKNFHMNMAYPKKIVGSTIDMEYLEDRPNFRYKKVNIIMGGNATGKTSLGKLLMLFSNYMEDGECGRFVNVIDDRTERASLEVDFVSDENILYRFSLDVFPNEEDDADGADTFPRILFTRIGKNDSYETCAERLLNADCDVTNYDMINTRGWHFSYPHDARKNKTYRSIENNKNYIIVLEKILKTLDPSIKEVFQVRDLDNTYAIRLENQQIIIQNGKIADTEILSSGTKAGLDISYIIASLICDMHQLYYCDELFSYVNSDVEKACLSIIIDKLVGRKQLFFTTHNTEILDLQLPKHSFMFLKKDVRDKEMPIKCITASQLLKRNTDSLKHAIENDLFSTAPSLELLYEITEL